MDTPRLRITQFARLLIVRAYSNRLLSPVVPASNRDRSVGTALNLKFCPKTLLHLCLQLIELIRAEITNYACPKRDVSGTGVSTEAGLWNDFLGLTRRPKLSQPLTDAMPPRLSSGMLILGF